MIYPFPCGCDPAELLIWENKETSARTHLTSDEDSSSQLPGFQLSKKQGTSPRPQPKLRLVSLIFGALPEDQRKPEYICEA